MGAETAHGAVPGATADTGVWGGEAADSTEGALGSRWGSRTCCQVVGALSHTQVLQRQGGRLQDSSAHVANTPPGTSNSAGLSLPCGVFSHQLLSHLFLQQGLEIFSEAKFKMITSGFLLFLS